MVPRRGTQEEEEEEEEEDLTPHALTWRSSASAGGQQRA